LKKKLAKERREKKAVERRAAAAEKKLRAQIREEKKEVQVVRSFASGLPPLGVHVASSTKSSENKNREPAKLRLGTFKVLKDAPLDRDQPATIWIASNRGELATWGSEADVKRQVRTVIQDAIAASDLIEQLQCYEELRLGVKGEQSDIWIVRSRSGCPVGVIEVKRPGAAIMESEYVHGQIFDYMKRLQSFFGLKVVFGIVSTYKQWRVCWLSGCSEEIAKAESLENIGETTLREESPRDKGERILCGTQVYKYDDRDLPILITSTLHKMNNASLFGFLPKNKRPRIWLKEEGWTWIGEQEIVENEDKMPSRQVRNFVLLEDFGSGRDGRVWKACSLKGEVCVIKFALPRSVNETIDDRKERLEKECQYWHDVWGETKARVIPLAGDYALVMPFAKLMERNEKDLDEGGRVRTAIEAMANKGLCHNDLRWRHVRLVNDRVVFIDLSDIEKMAKKESISNMITQLQNDLIEEDD